MSVAFSNSLLTELTWLSRISSELRLEPSSEFHFYFDTSFCGICPVRILWTESWYFNSQQITPPVPHPDQKCRLQSWLLILILAALSDDILMMVCAGLILLTLPYTKNTSDPAKTSSINPCYTFDTDYRQPARRRNNITTFDKYLFHNKFSTLVT